MIKETRCQVYCGIRNSEAQYIAVYIQSCIFVKGIVRN